MFGQIIFRIDNIAAEDISIAIMGMMIVFVALVLISLFIASLPRFLVILEMIFPTKQSHRNPSPTMQTNDEHIVAIGYTLRHRLKNRM